MAASIDDVAAAANVSTATVSRSLRGLSGVSVRTRDRVLAAADRLGYVASSSAAGLATGRTTAMGVLLPLIDRWYFSAALAGVDRALRSAGYDLVVFSLGGTGVNRERVFHRSMLRKRIDALLVMCMALTDGEQAALLELDCPVIMVGGHVEGVRSVSIDDEAAARDAVEHLLGLGHTRIAHLRGGGSFGLEFSVPLLRDGAYQEAMRRHGVAVRPEWTIFGDFRFDRAKTAAGRLLDAPGPGPTAIFASSDEMAFGAMTAARERGIAVPEQLSIIGIDDHEFAAPMGLTTVRQLPQEQGAAAAGILLRELGGRPQPATGQVARHELVCRRSTAPPPP